MNLVFEKLAEEAHMHVMLQHEFDRFNMQEFAEGVVRECISCMVVMTPKTGTDDEHNSLLAEQESQILKHFGMTE